MIISSSWLVWRVSIFDGGCGGLGCCFVLFFFVFDFFLVFFDFLGRGTCVRFRRRVEFFLFVFGEKVFMFVSGIRWALFDGSRKCWLK